MVIPLINLLFELQREWILTQIILHQEQGLAYKIRVKPLIIRGAFGYMETNLYLPKPDNYDLVFFLGSVKLCC